MEYFYFLRNQDIKTVDVYLYVRTQTRVKILLSQYGETL